MIDDKSYKARIINRIKNEKLEYIESFNKSLINQYTYLWKISYENNFYNGGISIIAPKYTDDTILEQAYQLAHELGHHNINKRTNFFILKLYKSNNILLKSLIERRAWEEAKNICIEESIPIKQEFYLIKDKCIKTYINEMKNKIRNILVSIIHIFLSYYTILLFSYLIYKVANDNINDIFGILKYFKDINNIEFLSKTIWLTYIVYYLIKGILKKMK